jgi:hypothetical protein
MIVLIKFFLKKSQTPKLFLPFPPCKNKKGGRGGVVVLWLHCHFATSTWMEEVAV